jgi:uncharacterized repeat protein (TIGR03843 family)
MCQLWIDAAPEAVVDVVPREEVPAGWRHIVDAEDQAGRPVSLIHADTPELQRLAILDAITNNTDRKGGHILVDAVGAIFGIDHGVCFHHEDKLRTVLWGWAGKPIDDSTLEGIAALEMSIGGTLGSELREHITAAELAALRRRVRALLDNPVMPNPERSRPLPWPAF